MHRAPRLVALAAATLLVGGLAACSDDADASSSGAGDFEPITIEHALGTTTIDEKPERVATVAWANHEVPLALGVVPVGMAAANFGDDDGDGLLPWVSERLEELDADVPVLFDETDGIDFEAVADTAPDVILAGYSGLTQEDYDTLSEIAPVIAYPEGPWATSWRDMIEINSAGMGMAAEGEELVADLEQEIADTVGEYPQLAGRATMFLTHVDTTDLSEVSFYTPYDTAERLLRGPRPDHAGERAGRLDRPGEVLRLDQRRADRHPGRRRADRHLRRPGAGGRAQRRPAALADARGQERRDRAAARHPAGHRRQPDAAGHLLGPRRLRRHARRGRRQGLLTAPRRTAVTISS
ncbi:ABC transporter substrate-binding protein [Blastococcus sp. TML/M2B]|nr:ABC transporter substrate-binding protein [Blastococcus sp. TML/M2B]MBN1093188.1 ABC transporter substrate-binding protein [Blastococcus sp. TML/M2B]